MRARCDVMADRSDREQGQPNLSLRHHSLISRMGLCSRTPSGPAVSTDCINRPDRRLHPTHCHCVNLSLATREPSTEDSSQTSRHVQKVPKVVVHNWSRRLYRGGRCASLHAQKCDTSSRNRGIPGSVSNSRWFIPGRDTNLEPGIPAASRRPSSAGCISSSRTCSTSVGTDNFDKSPVTSKLLTVS